MQEPRVIKRYANRKLYDCSESRYVTLQDVAQMVRAGDEVRIIDNKTQEDLTRVTLAQIIYEEEKKRPSGRPSAANLRRIIEEGREKLMESLPPSIGKLVRRDEAEGEEGEHVLTNATLDQRVAHLEDRVRFLENRLARE